jgi:pyruvate formate lyase activating enzyme
MREALLYEPTNDGHVHCLLCAHGCRLAPGARGICGVRENRDGRLMSLVYGRLIAQAVDPIEKKPLFHFYPGSAAFSIATMGCNFACTFCQNADISQVSHLGGEPAGREVSPEAVVAAAERYGCRSIAYTYTEPTVFYEYAADVARLARERGLANVWVSNGYMSAEMLDQALPAGGAPLIDAANVDLKAFREAFYRAQCGARLAPVLDSLRALKARGVWLEVTTLVIPGLNDSEEELGEIAAFVRDELGAETPWHVSRFHPTYRLTDRPPTPPATVRRAWEIGREAGLAYVYMGNLPGEDGEDTRCPACGATVIYRRGFAVSDNRLRGGACPECGAPVAGVGV